VDLHGLVLKPGCKGSRELQRYQVMNGMAVQSTVNRGPSLYFYFMFFKKNMYFLKTDSTSIYLHVKLKLL